jgi:hypothetical protein
MAEQERDLSAQSEAIRAALAQDEALAFEHALTQTRDDLSSIAEKLGDEQTGWTVQMLQGDVEQRLSDLLAVLDAERQRREALEKPEDNQPGQQQGGQQAPSRWCHGGRAAADPRLPGRPRWRWGAFSRTAAADEGGWTRARATCCSAGPPAQKATERSARVQGAAAPEGAAAKPEGPR